MKFRKRKTFFLAALLFLAFAPCAAAWVGHSHRQLSVKAAQNLTPAQFQATSTKLDALMKQQGMRATFAYVVQQMSVDPSFAKDCHPLLHQLGHDAYVYYGSYATAISYQNELCNSGYTHGVIEAYLSNAPNIRQVLQTACTVPASRTYETWQCYHGLGHGIMQISLKNVDKSLTLCETSPSVFDSNACANGVFMEHFVVEDHDGNIPSHNPTGLRDCANLANPTYKSYCYLYAPTAYLTVYDAQYAAALTWCAGAGKDYISTCVDGVGSQAMKDNIDKLQVAKQVCDTAKAYQVNCVFGAVSMYINYTVSSQSAEKLCVGEFAAYRVACQAAVTQAKQKLGI